MGRIDAVGGEEGGDTNFIGGTLLVKGRLMSEGYSVETEDGDIERLVPDNNVEPCVKPDVFFSAAVIEGLEPVSSLISIRGFARPTIPERAERVVTFPVDHAWTLEYDDIELPGLREPSNVDRGASSSESSSESDAGLNF